MDCYTGQMLVSLARAMRVHAEIVSGAYKTRKVFHGTVTNNGPEFTDEEKLQEKIEEMDRHIQIAQEIVKEEMDQ